MTASKNFCILNGELERIDSLNVAPVFIINDFVKEDLRLYDTRPLCLSLHVSNVIARLQAKNVDIPECCTSVKIDRYISRLLNVNKVYKGGICTILLYWQKFPELTKPQLCIFIKPLESLEYVFNLRGVELTFTSSKKEDNYVAESQYLVAEEQIRTTISFDKLGYGYVTPYGDVFAIRDNVIHVIDRLQPISTLFVDFITKKGWVIKKHSHITQDMILHSTEVVLCGTFIGIHWVSRIYYGEEEPLILGYSHAKSLYDLFNEFVRI